MFREEKVETWTKIIELHSQVETDQSDQVEIKLRQI